MTELAEDVVSFPGIGSLHEVFGQARTDPSTVTLFNGWTRLTTDGHGEMEGAPLHGFYAANTQLLTHYDLKINGEPVSHRLSVQLSSDEWTTTGALLRSGDYGNLPKGTLPSGSLEIRVLRKIDQGWTELIFVRNNGVPKRRVRVDLRFCVPIRDDQFSEEMKLEESLPWRGVVPSVSSDAAGIRLRFEKYFGRRKRAPTEELQRMYGLNAPKSGSRVTRGLEIAARVCAGTAHLKARPGRVTRLEATAHLGARAEFCLELRYSPKIDALVLPAPELTTLDPVPRKPASLTDCRTRIATSNSTLNLILGQAMVDLGSLRLPVFGSKDPAHDAINAGIPRYIGLFGRDNLVTARQSPLFGLVMIEPAISRLEMLQGIRREDWRDEEVGRFPHERRLDPLSEIGKVNRELYYGDVTSTPFWVLALSTLYQWTGDRDLLLRHRHTVERCCDWILRRIDEGRGFIAYAPAMPGHKDENRNQAWKDSGDAIVDADGRICVPPLSVAEIQGCAYQALVEAAEIFRLLDCSEPRPRLLHAAAELKKRFNRGFWMPEQDFYALALDAEGRPVASIASNIGHCLATGILDDRRIPSVIRRFMAPDLFSGWGLRTLSADNQGYDPFSYHRGSVWPVENASIANGMAVLGWHDEALRISTAQFAVAALFPHMRLPELISGHARTGSAPTPGMYNFGNLLQAWSVSAIAQHLQAILGVRPRADLGALYLDPHLPEWLRWVELRNLEVGKERLHLRFWRDSRGKSRWEAIQPPGTIEIRSGAPTGFGRQAMADSAHGNSHGNRRTG